MNSRANKLIVTVAAGAGVMLLPDAPFSPVTRAV